jgi:hypothetical protein
VPNILNTSFNNIKIGDQMGVLNEETVRMRYLQLVKKGIIEDDECSSYNSKVDVDPCMMRQVENFEDYFVPGTVLLSDRASYKLRIEYPME